MKLRNGMTIKNARKVTEYGGQHGYLAWVEGCFDPPVWFVRGDTFEDAYANLLDDEHFVRFAGIEITDLERGDYGPEDGIWNERGQWLDDEAVHMTEWRRR